MAAPGNCVFVSGAAVGASTILLPGRIWTELECAQAVVQAHQSANGAIHEANDGDCTAVLDMQSVAADPAGLQKSCFIYSAATPTNQICTVAPSACDAAEHGTPFEGADLTLPGRALGGSIPTQLGVLAQLTALDLSDNMLSGSMPSQLGLLTQLETLDLGYNRLSGSVHPNLDSCHGSSPSMWQTIGLVDRCRRSSACYTPPFVTCFGGSARNRPGRPMETAATRRAAVETPVVPSRPALTIIASTALCRRFTLVAGSVGSHSRGAWRVAKTRAAAAVGSCHTSWHQCKTCPELRTLLCWIL